MEPLTLVAWSDYLCPWCYNATVRLERLEDEFDGRVSVEWRSYLLRPNPSGRRDPERFRAYTQSWLRPAGDEDSGIFRPWQSDAAPPSHSVPPHQVAKAARRHGAAAFRRIHRALLHAYFADNRDISDPDTLRALWIESGLPEARFAEREEPAILEQIVGEHAEALEGGATGVPAVRLAGNDAIVVGAHPLELYRRWVTRALAARERCPA